MNPEQPCQCGFVHLGKPKRPRKHEPQPKRPRSGKRPRGFAAPEKAKILFDLAVKQQNLCALCNRPFTSRWPPTLDHIDPIANGGDSKALDNLQAAHGPCNNMRGHMTMKHWVMWKWKHREKLETALS